MLVNHHQTSLLIWAAVSLFLASCNPGEAPPPPSSEPSSVDAGSKVNSRASSEDASSADAQAPLNKVEKSAANRSVLPTSVASPADDPMQLSADVGDAAMKQAAKSCVSLGFFYDRTEAGRCAPVPLSKFTCTLAYIESAMSEPNRKVFMERLSAPDYQGYVIDQCIECDGLNADPVCTKQDGNKLTGKRFYFAKESRDSAGNLVVTTRYQTIEVAP